MMTNRPHSSYELLPTGGREENSGGGNNSSGVGGGENSNHAGNGTIMQCENPFNTHTNSTQKGLSGSQNWKWLFRMLGIFSLFYMFVAVSLLKRIEFPEKLLYSTFAGQQSKSTGGSGGTQPGVPHFIHFPTDYANLEKGKQEEIQELKHKLDDLTKRLVDVQQTPAEHKAEVKGEVKEGESVFTTSTILPILPASSAWCYGERKNRVCRFKNLYYDANKKEWIFVKTTNSVTVGLEDADLRNILDLTTIEEHNAFFFRLSEVAQSAYIATKVERVSKFTFVLSRFHTGNIMHAIHDDLLGLYQLFKEFADENPEASSKYSSFSRDNFVLFFDPHDEGGYGHVFKYITDNPLQFRANLDKTNNVYWLPDCVVGNSKLLNWYQYGFIIPQGPIAGKTVNGFFIREVADYISHRLEYPEWDIEEWQAILKSFLKNAFNIATVPSSQSDSLPLLSDKYNIVIFSRRHDRLIVNEDELAVQLKKRFRLPVLFVRNEDLSFAEQVKILRNTVVAIGMHGSLLIMGMFMQPGSLLVEMYPYAVPCENYTPYRTLCGLEGMNISYRAWSNKHSQNNTSFPDRIPHYGGIAHLPEEEQRKIVSTDTVPTHLCCTNPYWLFRIFQDTRVDFKELEETILDGLKHSPFLLESFLNYKPPISPTNVSNPVCTFNKQERAIHLKWDPPSNIPPNDRNVYYRIWSHEHYKEFSSDTTSITIADCDPEKPHDVWIKPVLRGKEQSYAAYSDKVVCTPE